MKNKHDLTYGECIERFGEAEEYQKCIQECARFIQTEYPNQDVDICISIMDNQTGKERFSDTYSRLKEEQPELFDGF